MNQAKTTLKEGATMLKPMDQEQPESFARLDLFENFSPRSGKTARPIEIDEDGAPSLYQDDRWEDLIVSLTVNWVKEVSFVKTGGIYRWCAPSCTFSRLWASTFYILAGMSASFRQYLGGQMEYKLKKSVRAYSDELKPKAYDGWSKAVHIESVKVWSQYDGERWTLSTLD